MNDTITAVILVDNDLTSETEIDSGIARLQLLVDEAAELGFSPVLAVLNCDSEQFNRLPDVPRCLFILGAKGPQNHVDALRTGCLALPSYAVGAAIFLLHGPTAHVAGVHELIQRFQDAGTEGLRPLLKGEVGYPVLLSAEKCDELVEAKSENEIPLEELFSSLNLQSINCSS